jgi:hypothetical protein
MSEVIKLGNEIGLLRGSIHDWGTKKECLIEKGLQRTTLNIFLFYIIIIAVDCYMARNTMMSS